MFLYIIMCVFCFRRKVHRVLESVTTRRTHCAVVVEAAAIIFRRRPVLVVVIQRSVCANVSGALFNNLHLCEDLPQLLAAIFRA